MHKTTSNSQRLVKNVLLGLSFFALFLSTFASGQLSSSTRLAAHDVTLPPEFDEDFTEDEMLFGAVAYQLSKKLDSTELSELCPDVDAIMQRVEAALSDVDFSNACQPLEEAASRCEEARDYCDEFKQNNTQREDKFRLTCPPNEQQLISMCIDWKSSYREEIKGGVETGSRLDCELEWSRNQEYIQRACSGEEPELEVIPIGVFPEEKYNRTESSRCPILTPGWEDQCRAYGGTPTTQLEGQCVYPRCDVKEEQVRNYSTAGQCYTPPSNWQDQCRQYGGNPVTRTGYNNCPEPYCEMPQQQTTYPTSENRSGTQEQYPYYNTSTGTSQYPSSGQYPAYNTSGGQTQQGTYTCPTYPSDWQDSCTRSGGTPSTYTDSNGCTVPQCTTSSSTSTQTTTNTSGSSSDSGSSSSSGSEGNGTVTQARSPPRLLTALAVAATQLEEERAASRSGSSSRPGSRPDFCDRSSFIQQCRERVRAYVVGSYSNENVREVCATEVRNNLPHIAKFCEGNRYTGKGEEGSHGQCVSQVARSCEKIKGALQRCKSTSFNKQAFLEKARKHAVNMCRSQGLRLENPQSNFTQTATQTASLLANISTELPPEYAAWAIAEQDSLVDVTQEVVNTTSQQRDAVYALTQLLGLQGQRERENAAQLREQAAKLGETIESLRKLAAQVGEAEVRAQLEVQITALEAQKAQLEAQAAARENFADGIFGAIAKLLGG